jgi:hypothetical protein
MLGFVGCWLMSANQGDRGQGKQGYKGQGNKGQGESDRVKENSRYCHGATLTNNGPVASDSKARREVLVFGETILSYFDDSQEWLKDLCGS